MNKIEHNNPPEDQVYALNLTIRDEVFEDKHRCLYSNVATFIAECGDLDTMPASILAHVMVHVKDQYEKLDAEKKKLGEFLELLKTSKIPDAFEREKIKTFTMEDGTRVTKSERTTCTILEQTAAYEWLRKNGYKDIIKETVNAQTMGSVAKEILSNQPEPIYDENKEIVGYTQVEGPSDLPEDLFNVKIQATTSVTKGKK